MNLSLNIIKITINWLVEILSPSVCFGCKKRGQIFCSDCLSKINRIEKETTENIIAVFEYHNPLIKKVIWNLKYYHHPYLGRGLGELLYNELLEDISDMKIYTIGSSILVIPVPISKKKMRVRGYNQAQKIAQGFCSKENKNIMVVKTNIIIKKTETIPQARITNRLQRLKNVHNTFEIKRGADIQGRTIIIIDDVTTTGGTINEIINILKKAGARNIVGFAIAH